MTKEKIQDLQWFLDYEIKRPIKLLSNRSGVGLIYNRQTKKFEIWSNEGVCLKKFKDLKPAIKAYEAYKIYKEAIKI